MGIILEIKSSEVIIVDCIRSFKPKLDAALAARLQNIIVQTFNPLPSTYESRCEEWCGGK
jgi:hypothetical protein